VISLIRRLKHFPTRKDRQQKYDDKDGDKQEEEESGHIRSRTRNAGEPKQCAIIAITRNIAAILTYFPPFQFNFPMNKT